MEKRASEEGGTDVTKTLDYGKVYMDHHKKTLEIMMGHVQQPPLSPFNYKGICWWNEYCVMPQHGVDGTCIHKKAYMAYIPWDIVDDFLVGEKTMGMCSANSFK
jgi:hypothetical protein